MLYRGSVFLTVCSIAKSLVNIFVYGSNIEKFFSFEQMTFVCCNVYIYNELVEQKKNKTCFSFSS